MVVRAGGGMAKIERFEDIQAWQKSRTLVKAIYDVTGKKVKLNKDYGLKEQIRRASVSVMSNIAEGFARRRDKEFGRFLSIALGSAAEVQSQLYVALDQGYITKKEFEELYELASEAARLINGFIQYLRTD
jgi:four helix bundle protein